MYRCERFGDVGPYRIYRRFPAGRTSFLSRRTGLRWSSHLRSASRRRLAPTLSVPDNTPAIFEGCVIDPALVAADRERFTVELAPGRGRRFRSSPRHDGRSPTCPTAPTSNSRAKSAARTITTIPAASMTSTISRGRRSTGMLPATPSTVRVLPGRCGNRARGIHFRHSIRRARPSRPSLRERRLRQRHDAGHSDRRDRETRPDVDRGLSFDRHLSRARDFGQPRGGAGGSVSVLSAHLRRSRAASRLC